MMFYVPEIKTLIQYLAQRKSFNKSYTDLVRQNIFELDKNIIVFNKNYLDAIQTIIDDTHELKDDFTIYLTKLMDNIGTLSVNAGSCDESFLSEDQIFEYLCHYNTEHQILIGITENKENLENPFNILNLNNISEKNKNYIYAKLLTNETCQIQYIDLDSNAKIVDLLNSVYKLYPSWRDFIIIDRQTNLNHNLYDAIIKDQNTFKYYTYQAKLADRQAVKGKFKNYILYSTNNIDLIHERMLIINDLMIVFDEDPYNIVYRNTWTITISCCPESIEKIQRHKCALFPPVNF